MVNADEQTTSNYNRPFTITGRCSYLIGFMNGSFPDMGQHLPGEMGGLWAPPFKLADGFWFGVSKPEQPGIEWMYGANCQLFELKPGMAERKFLLQSGEIAAQQTMFVPETEPGVVLAVRLANTTEQQQEIMLHWLVRFDIQGAWWSSWPDRPDEAQYDASEGYILANDTLNNQWCAAMGASQLPENYSIGAELWAAEKTSSLYGTNISNDLGILPNREDLQGQGVSGRLDYRLSLAPGESQILHFAISGGGEGAEFARQNVAKLLRNHVELLEKKQSALTALLANTPQLITPRPELTEVFTQSALCMDLLTLDLPQVGRGVVAGFPHFAWFFGCDTYYTLSGLLLSGQAETALGNLRILANYAKKQHGRIPHEITPSGRLFNPGNTVETPEFVTSVERAYRWTGNLAFLSEMYDLCRVGIFEYVLGECDPTGDMLPEGAGLLELRSAEYGKKLDVACSLYQALHSLAYLAGVMGDKVTARKSSGIARQLQQKIENHFWIEARQEYAWRIEPDLTLKPDEPAHSYAVLEMGVLEDKERATRLFERVEGPEHTGPRGIIHPGTVDFVMPIQNAILAQAEFRYGRPDKGLWYLERMSELCGYYMPWAIPEFVGTNACFIQAWSSAAFNWLIIQGFFRLNPDPVRNVVQVQPQLPLNWDFLEIKNLNIWEGCYDLRLKRVDSIIEFSYEEHTPSPRNPQFELWPPAFPASFV